MYDPGIDGKTTIKKTKKRNQPTNQQQQQNTKKDCSRTSQIP